MAELKQAGRNDFTQIPNGSPGAGDRLHMVWTEGVCTGKLTRQKFVDVIATQPAKINGIYPRKGTLAVGSDADVVIFDPNYEGLRGQVVVENAKFVGRYGQGKFIPANMYASGYENRN